MKIEKIIIKNHSTGVKRKKTRIINQSVTDPDSGVFHKGEHKKCFAYEAHTGCDKNGLKL